MSDHALWKGITPMTDPHLREVQMAYVDGYCLALEDVLEWLSALQAEDPGQSRYRPVRRVVGQHLEAARKTLKHLKERNERTAAPGAELEQGLRGDLGGLPGQPPLQDTASE